MQAVTARASRPHSLSFASDAQTNRNVMPAIVEAVHAYATVGEITNELVAVYGRYQEPVKFERDA